VTPFRRSQRVRLPSTSRFVPTGVTVREFFLLLKAQVKYGQKPVPFETVKPFLDRCCEIGFLERRNEAPFGTRYYPTEALVEWASWFE
jgi:hypothetical protein